MRDLCTSSATELAASIHSGEISSRELLEFFLDRIERLNPDVNAVVTLDVDRALERAEAADEATARGESWGPLHGLAITVKDAIETEGIRSTGGAVELSDHVPAADAPVVSALKDAGAVVFGKTNCPRWSADVQTFNQLFGTTNNPWDLSRTPGGSSGGAAAAVACGFTSFETGTDIGGSIRTPAHFCGVYGLKPTYGVVPQRGYLDHVGGGTTHPDVNVFGPIARSADDLDLLLGVMGGPDPDRAPAWRVDLPPPRRTELAEYRVGVWFDEPACPIGADMRAVLSRVGPDLEGAGVKVEESHPRVDFKEQVALFFSLVGAAMSVSYPDGVAEALGGSHLTWIRNDEQRVGLRRTWVEWFDEFDLLLCPASITAAFPHDQQGEFFERVLTVDGVERSHLELASWTGLIGVLGLPAVVPPLGRTAEGLPIGVQVVAAPHRDREAIVFARRLADLIGGSEPPPGF